MPLPERVINPVNVSRKKHFDLLLLCKELSKNDPSFLYHHIQEGR